MRPKSRFSQVILDSIAILDFQFGQLSLVKPKPKLINATTELKGNSTELKVYRFQFPHYNNDRHSKNPTKKYLERILSLHRIRWARMLRIQTIPLEEAQSLDNTWNQLWS